MSCVDFNDNHSISSLCTFSAVSSPSATIFSVQVSRKPQVYCPFVPSKFTGPNQCLPAVQLSRICKSLQVIYLKRSPVVHTECRPKGSTPDEQLSVGLSENVVALVCG